MLKIGITGSNNTGKTTLSYNLTTRFKVSGYRADIAHESVRSCPLGIKNKATVEAQIWIVGNQIKLEEELSSTEDIVICDKTVIDSCCYGIWAYKRKPDKKNKLKLEILKELCLAYAKTYDLIFYTPLIKNIPYHKWHSKIDHRKKIDRMILDFLKQNKIPYFELPQKFDERLITVFKIINDRFNIPLLKEIRNI